MASKLYEALKDKPDVREKFYAASSKEEAFDIVKELIPDYTIDDLVAELKEIGENSKKMSDDELDAVAGGYERYHDISDEEFLEEVFGMCKKLFSWLS